MGPEGSPYQVQCRIDVPPKVSLKPMCREVFSSWRYPFQSEHYNLLVSQLGTSKLGVFKLDELSEKIRRLWRI